MESVGKLRSAFKKGGVITAANASNNDGASAAVIMSAKELGLKHYSR